MDKQTHCICGGCRCGWSHMKSTYDFNRGYEMGRLQVNQRLHDEIAALKAALAGMYDHAERAASKSEPLPRCRACGGQIYPMPVGHTCHIHADGCYPCPVPEGR